MKNTNVNFAGMSYNDLATTSQRVANFAKQDAILLAPLGVTPELITDFETKINALIAIPKHQFVLGEKSKTTIERDESIAIVQQTIKELRSQAMFVESLTIGEHNATFNVSLYNADAGKTIDIASLMLTVLNKTKEDLTQYGITAERITQFETQINDLISKTVNQEEKTVALNDSTSERNAIRAEVTSLLKFVSQMGQVYWGSKQKTKRDNYVVIRNSPPNSVSISEPSVETSQEADEVQISNF